MSNEQYPELEDTQIIDDIGPKGASGSGSNPLPPQELDRKWHFIPPAGSTPIKRGWLFLLGILIILFIEFSIWGIYRKFTAPIYGPGFNLPFFIGHIIAAPLIHLVPILLYWRFIRKERWFSRDDLDGDRADSISFGPFKMTRRFLFSAVLVGLFGGIMWRLMEMISQDIFTIMFGGAVAGELRLWNIFATNDFGIFLLMTFVMFFIVGPVEEFEFRSFTHDQSARVLPMWKALIFSSVMFGLSHLPIALTIYTQTYNWKAIDVIVAEIGWITAGFTFGALYMWSRNIFACIVMHGIGNWQLSTYFLQSEATATGLTYNESLIVSVLVSIVANVVMIGVFFLIHKFYWEPQRRGEPAFGGLFIGIQKWIFDHDVGNTRLTTSAGILTAITVVVLIVLAGGVNIVGVDVGEGSNDGSTDDSPLSGMTRTMRTIPMTGNLAVDESRSEIVQVTEFNLVSAINVTLRWVDEPDMTRFGRTYTNQPETFSLSINGPNVSVEETASNEVHQEGVITLTVELGEDQIVSLSVGDSFEITVTLVDSGIYSPRVGVIGYNDNINDFTATIEVVELVVDSTGP